MHNHGPTCLEGPVSRQRTWWKALDPVALEPTPATGVAEEPEDGMRLELVERVRREIAAGIYDTPEKWEIALDRLLDVMER